MRLYKLLLIILLTITITTGCRTIKPSSTSERKDSIVYVSKIQHDSINVYKHDSVLIRQKGDTIFKDSYHTLIKYKEKLNTDTTKVKEYYNVNHTVYVNQLTKLQKGLMWFGLISLVGLIGFGVLKFKKIV